jgi:hypothetical protein
MESVSADGMAGVSVVFLDYLSGDIETEGTTDFTDATDLNGFVTVRRISGIRGSFLLFSRVARKIFANGRQSIMAARAARAAGLIRAASRIFRRLLASESR